MTSWIQEQQKKSNVIAAVAQTVRDKKSTQESNKYIKSVAAANQVNNISPVSTSDTNVGATTIPIGTKHYIKKSHDKGNSDTGANTNPNNGNSTDTQTDSGVNYILQPEYDTYNTFDYVGYNRLLEQIMGEVQRESLQERDRLSAISSKESSAVTRRYVGREKLLRQVESSSPLQSYLPKWQGKREGRYNRQLDEIYNRHSKMYDDFTDSLMRKRAAEAEARRKEYYKRIKVQTGYKIVVAPLSFGTYNNKVNKSSKGSFSTAGFGFGLMQAKRGKKKGIFDF